jgi:peroxiredoxin
MKLHIHFFYFAFLCLVSLQAFSQYQVTGKFSKITNQKIQLLGFEGVQAYLIDEATIDQNGNFSLNYQDDDYGMGYLSINDSENQILILAKEQIEIQGQNLSDKSKLNFVKGNENKLFTDFNELIGINQNAISAWQYLANTYANSNHLKNRTNTISTIQDEIKYIYESENQFINNLPENSYIKWFIPVRELISNVRYIQEQEPELAPKYVEAFRKLQHDNDLFYKSGLYKDAFEGHFWLIENSNSNTKAVHAEMKKSIDVIIDNLAFDDQKMNQTGEFLFQYFETKNLNEISEYLAVKLLNESSCTLNSSFEKQLEVYRKMKPGQIAKNIVFEGDVFKNAKPVNLSSLEDIKTEYYLIAFGSSWCPACVQELPKLQKEYADFKNKNVEIVMVSLDTSKQNLINFIQEFDFYVASDYKKWDTQAVSDYHVFSTPTLYLIDKNKKILLRPNNIAQAKAWVQRNL